MKVIITDNAKIMKYDDFKFYFFETLKTEKLISIDVNTGSLGVVTSFCEFVSLDARWYYESFKGFPLLENFDGVVMTQKDRENFLFCLMVYVDETIKI